MYLRKTQRRNRDGRVVRYLQLARNQRVDGTTRAEVLVSLGREDTLDTEVLRRLADSIHRYLGEGEEDDAARDSPVQDMRELPEMETARPLGAVWLLDGLWRDLGLGPALDGLLDGPRVERTVFALVANRALAPESRRAAHRWATEEVVVPGLPVMEGNGPVLHAMDLLLEAEGELHSLVGGIVARISGTPAPPAPPPDVDLVFFDTAGTEGLPHLAVGFAVTEDGLPARCWAWPADGSGPVTAARTVRQAAQDVRSGETGPVRTVVSSGALTPHLLSSAPELGSRLVTGGGIRTSGEADEALPHAWGRFRPVRQDLRAREVRIGEDGRRRILWHEAEEAQRDAALRSRQLNSLEAELRCPPTSHPPGAAPSEAERALLDHPFLGRWLTPHLRTGRPVLDGAAVAADTRLDGIHLLTPHQQDMPVEHAAAGYASLLRTERAFAAMGSTLYLQPVYHRLEDRSRAHVLLCWLALLLARVAEQRTGRPWSRVAAELDRIQRLTLHGPDGRRHHRTTRITAAQRRLMKACGVQPPT